MLLNLNADIYFEPGWSTRLLTFLPEIIKKKLTEYIKQQFESLFYDIPHILHPFLPLPVNILP